MDKFSFYPSSPRVENECIVPVSERRKAQPQGLSMRLRGWRSDWSGGGDGERTEGRRGGVGGGWRRGRVRFGRWTEMEGVGGSVDRRSDQESSPVRSVIHLTVQLLGSSAQFWGFGRHHASVAKASILHTLSVRLLVL